MPINIHPAIKLSEALKMGTRLDNYYFFPYWVEVKEDGTMVAYSFDDIPNDLAYEMQARREDQL